MCAKHWNDIELFEIALNMSLSKENDEKSNGLWEKEMEKMKKKKP